MAELLNEQELHLLGLQALIPWLEERKYTVDYVQPEKTAVPHIFALSGKILTVIVAATAMYPQKGYIAEADKAAALKVAEELNALCACASIGLVNVDGVEQGDKLLMGTPLRSGKYRADFSGLEFIHFEDEV